MASIQKIVVMALFTLSLPGLSQDDQTKTDQAPVYLFIAPAKNTITLHVRRGNELQTCFLELKNEKYDLRNTTKKEVYELFFSALLSQKITVKDIKKIPELEPLQGYLNVSEDGNWGSGSWSAFITEVKAILDKNKDKEIIDFTLFKDQAEQPYSVKLVDLNRAIENMNIPPRNLPPVELQKELDDYKKKVQQRDKSLKEKNDKISELNNENLALKSEIIKARNDSDPEVSVTPEKMPPNILINFIALSGYLLTTLLLLILIFMNYKRGGRELLLEQNLKTYLSEWKKESVHQVEQILTQKLSKTFDRGIEDIKLDRTQAQQHSLPRTTPKESTQSKLRKQRPAQNKRGLSKEVKEAIRKLDYEFGQLQECYFDGFAKEIPGNSYISKMNRLLSIIARWKESIGNPENEMSDSDIKLLRRLENGEKKAKEILSKFRKKTMPRLKPFKETVPFNVQSYTELEKLFARHKKLLSETEYETEMKNSQTERDEDGILKSIILNDLFEGIGPLFPEQTLPQLNEILQLISYELLPITINETEVHFRDHDVQQTIGDTDYPNAVVGVIMPGLRSCLDGKVIRKAMVVRGE